MKTVSVKMTWEGAAKEVSVGGEFNGWAPVPLFCQQGPFCQQGETWAVHLDIEPGCYTYRFLVDGSWKVKEGEGEEVEEDEKGEKANVLIVEEEEEEVEQGAVEKEIIEEAAKEEVVTIQDVLDTLTLENKQEIIDNHPEDTKSSEILKEETSKEEKVEEKIEKKVEEEVEKEIVKKVEPKVEIKETRFRKGKLTDKENTPKIQKESALAKEGTPKNGTPVIKASKLGTPKLGTPKTGKLGKLHPDDIESPRRITRFDYIGRNYYPPMID